MDLTSLFEMENLRVFSSHGCTVSKKQMHLVCVKQTVQRDGIVTVWAGVFSRWEFPLAGSNQHSVFKEQMVEGHPMVWIHPEESQSLFTM